MQEACIATRTDRLQTASDKPSGLPLASTSAVCRKQSLKTLDYALRPNLLKHFGFLQWFGAKQSRLARLLCALKFVQGATWKHLDPV